MRNHSASHGLHDRLAPESWKILCQAGHVKAFELFNAAPLIHLHDKFKVPSDQVEQRDLVLRASCSH